MLPRGPAIYKIAALLLSYAGIRNIGASLIQRYHTAEIGDLRIMSPCPWAMFHVVFVLPDYDALTSAISGENNNS